MNEDNKSAIGSCTPEYELAEVVEHKTKVVNGDPLKLGQLLKIRCNICELEYLYGRQTKTGEFLPDAWCSHVSFVGVVEPDA